MYIYVVLCYRRVAWCYSKRSEINTRHQIIVNMSKGIYFTTKNTHFGKRQCYILDNIPPMAHSYCTGMGLEPVQGTGLSQQKTIGSGSGSGLE